MGISSLIELLLQAFISVVDAELFEAVFFEALEAVDVQYAQGRLCLLLAH